MLARAIAFACQVRKLVELDQRCAARRATSTLRGRILRHLIALEGTGGGGSGMESGRAQRINRSMFITSVVAMVISLPGSLDRLDTRNLS